MLLVVVVNIGDRNDTRIFRGSEAVDALYINNNEQIRKNEINVQNQNK